MDEIVQMFYKAGRFEDALGEAARWGDIESIVELIKLGINPNCKTSLGSFPLKLAASGGQLEAIKLLLSHGADPNSTNEDGEHSLFACLWARHSREVYLACCSELIRHGARTDMVNKSALSVEALAMRRGLTLEELTT
ncbi:MAG: ankyrin repeat domain-containing protein [Pirellula sp.]|jgi:ankyrin repeat protein